MPESKQLLVTGYETDQTEVSTEEGKNRHPGSWTMDTPKDADSVFVISSGDGRVTSLVI